MPERPGPDKPQWSGLRFLLGWILAPLLIGGGLLAAMTQQALLNGARQAVLRAAVTLGNGDLTIQPKQDGAVVRVIRDAGPLYTNTALMEMPARTVSRLALPVAVTSARATVDAELTGNESRDDPQPVLLSRFVTAGSWPGIGDSPKTAGDPYMRTADKHGVALGNGLAGRLGVILGDRVRVQTGAGPAKRAFEGRVAALVYTGLARVDDGRLWTTTEAARELLTLPRGAREEAVTSLAIYLDQPEQAVDWLVAVRRATLPPGVEILTWRQVDPRTLPAELWVRALQRTERFAFIGTTGGALLAALLAVFGMAAGTRGKTAPATPRWGARRVLRLAAPAAIGLVAGAAVYGCCWELVRAHPLSPARAFGLLGAELNTTGGLTGMVPLALDPGQVLPWLGESVGVYAIAALGLSWLLMTRTRKA